MNLLLNFLMSLLLIKAWSYSNQLLPFLLLINAVCAPFSNMYKKKNRCCYKWPSDDCLYLLH
uniref:Uncharacterized protein n=1 Tax=Arundo donax TaxID=35708 RepID=A0A0A9FY34_ARUDO